LVDADALAEDSAYRPSAEGVDVISAFTFLPELVWGQRCSSCTCRRWEVWRTGKARAFRKKLNLRSKMSDGLSRRYTCSSIGKEFMIGLQHHFLASSAKILNKVTKRLQRAVVI